MFKVHLLGIDTGASEFFKTYSEYSSLSDKMTCYPITKQAQVILGGQIKSIKEIKNIISPNDIVLVGGDRAKYLNEIKSINAYKVHVFDYILGKEVKCTCNYNLKIYSTILKDKVKDSELVVTNPYVLEVINKLKGIKQPNNGKLIYFLQSSDNPYDELYSKFAFTHLINNYGRIFSEIYIKEHPNTVTDTSIFISNYNKFYGNRINLIKEKLEIEEVYSNFQHVASYNSSVTVQGMIAGLRVIHCINPSNLEKLPFSDILECSGKFNIKTNIETACKEIDDIILKRYRSEVIN